MARINFRQGIVRHQTDNSNNPVFLQKTGQDVNLLVSPDFTIISFIHGTKDYLFTESVTVNAAWASLPTGIDSWLYWDLNKTSGIRTFGHTLFDPITSATAPSTPSIGQMWFDTTKNCWFEYSGSMWVEVIRVFAAKLIGGSTLASMSANSPLFTGTQIGNNTTVNVGSLTFDHTGKPIINQDGKFFTTEDVFTSGVPTGASLKVNNILVRAIAQEPIGEYQVVQFSDYNKVVLANPFEATNSIYGIVDSAVSTNGVANIITEGVIFNDGWDWEAAGAVINDPLYIDATGQITITPDIPGQVPVAAVIGKQEILFKLGIYGFNVAESADHSTLTGLNGDDHPQYALTDGSRGDFVPVTEKGTFNGVATLDGAGLIPNSQLPPLAISNTFAVADQAAMLALSAETGDVAIRSDENKSYILQGTDPSILGHWLEMLTPTDAVISVAGKQGVVTLVKADITDFSEGDYATAAQGTLADSALQDVTAESIKNLSDVFSAMVPADGQALIFDSTNGWQSETLPAGGILNVVEDVTPQLGGDLDVNGSNIVSADTTGISSAPNINITAGSINHTFGYAGTTYLSGGDSVGAGGYGGDARIGGGAATNGNLGSKILSYGGSNTGGKLRMYGGTGSTGMGGGYVKLIGGAGFTPGGYGGYVQIQGGAGETGVNSTGGNLSLLGGAPGGDVLIRSGARGNSSLTGSLTIETNDVSGVAAGNSGILTISTGRVHDGVVGDLLIEGGEVGDDAGTSGSIKITPGGFTTSRTVGSDGSVQIHSPSSRIGQGAIELWDDTDAGHTTGNFVALKAPSGASGVTFTLPATDGTTGQALITDASGNLSFGSFLTSFTTNLVEDLTPQLGGPLDVQTHSIITADGTVSSSAEDINITAGQSTNTGYAGGYVNITGGMGSGGGDPGGVKIITGHNTGAGSWAGTLSLYTGGGGSTEFGGTVVIKPGVGTIAGGNTSIYGGIGSGSTANGGDLDLRGGNGGSSAGGNGGDITILPGSAYAAGNLNLIGGQTTNASGTAGGIILTPGGGTGIAGSVEIHSPNGIAGEASVVLWNDTNTSHSAGNTVALKASSSLAADITFEMPATDGLNGQALQTNASGVTSFGGPPLFTGSGSPEGVVTAPVGSLYTDTAGGVGSTLYVKESGTGNTGWAAK